MKWWAPIVLLQLLLPVAAKEGGNYTVLVFGDSWGSLGPSWHAIVDVFAAHNVPATVRSSAKGGTTACQWAEHGGIALAAEAAKLFPNSPDGPDFVWYTLGGNDLVNKDYAACSAAAPDDATALACMANQTRRATDCTQALLGKFFAAFPKAKVMQCGYDIPCQDSSCIKTADARNAYCRSNTSCFNQFTAAWQGMLLDPVAAAFPEPAYTALNILGTAQAAGGVPGASPGHPNLTAQGTPCDLMTSCVHPKHGKAGATAIGEAFWSMYFSKHV